MAELIKDTRGMRSVQWGRPILAAVSGPRLNRLTVCLRIPRLPKTIFANYRDCYHCRDRASRKYTLSILNSGEHSAYDVACANLFHFQIGCGFRANWKTPYCTPPQYLAAVSFADIRSSADSCPEKSGPFALAGGIGGFRPYGGRVPPFRFWVMRRG